MKCEEGARIESPVQESQEAFVWVDCGTLESLISAVRWAHERRRQWRAYTMPAGWRIEIEGLPEDEWPEDVDDRVEMMRQSSV